MKSCSVCGFKWPAAMFTPVERDDAGRVVRRHAQCKHCRNERAREQRAVRQERPEGWTLPDRRRCTICREWKDTLRDFYVRERWADGTVRSVHSYCKPCEKATVSSRQRESPARQEYLRRYAEENRDNERRRKREWAAEKRARELAEFEAKVDVLEAQLRTRGVEVVERRRSRAGRTLTLEVEAADGPRSIRLSRPARQVARTPGDPLP